MDHSPLSKLPAEIRNRIAELALHRDEGDGCIHVWPHGACSIKATFALGSSDRKPLKRPRNLIQTCKQLRLEYRLLFFAVNNFVFHNRYISLSSHQPICFFQAVGEKVVAAMQGFIIDFQLANFAGNGWEAL